MSCRTFEEMHLLLSLTCKPKQPKETLSFGNIYMQNLEILGRLSDPNVTMETMSRKRPVSE